MYYTGQILAKHLPKLTLDFLLNEFLDNSERIESAVDIDILKRVGLEDECDTLLARDDKDDV